MGVFMWGECSLLLKRQFYPAAGSSLFPGPWWVGLIDDAWVPNGGMSLRSEPWSLTLGDARSTTSEPRAKYWVRFCPLMWSSGWSRATSPACGGTVMQDWWCIVLSRAIIQNEANDELVGDIGLGRRRNRQGLRVSIILLILFSNVVFGILGNCDSGNVGRLMDSPVQI